jgi:NhaB family Na+:H+ antiporter
MAEHAAMTLTLPQALFRNFLGHSPVWYKWTVIACLAANPLILYVAGPTVAGWCVVAEFIFTLAMALKCYPLQPGGLLAIESILLGLASAESVYRETLVAMPVLMLLIFMVAGIFFLKDLLLFVFTKLLLNVRSQTALALMFCATAAVLAAFVGALTVVAVVMTVGAGFYEVYHRVASGKHHDAEHDFSGDANVGELHRSDLDAFRAFLRGLIMHAAVGTALGGMTTAVGEPQNLLLAAQAQWSFGEFFLKTAPVALPILALGLLTCVAVDKLRWFGYGTPLPTAVLQVLREHHALQVARHSARERGILIVQAVAAILLVLGLGFHVAEVGLIGLGIIVFATAFTGVTEEHRIGKAFEVALPFTALLVVFFAIVAVIRDQYLFELIIEAVLNLEGQARLAMMYLANGFLSIISDNVFVATIYIREVKAAFLQGLIDREQFEQLVVAINVGSNAPSVATPNGQAAFLFLLTSTLAPLIRLSYGRMVWMALPYAVVLTLAGLAAMLWWL